MKLLIVVFLIVILAGCTRPAVIQPMAYPDHETSGPVIQTPGTGYVFSPVPQNHPCWDMVKEETGDYYDAVRNWLHDVTHPDCKANPDARGCR